jgi:hypothetical protein
VAVDSPLAPARLLALLGDPERLLRVNPLWVFEVWERPEPDRFRLRVRNQSNGRTWDAAGRIERLADGLRLHYDDGIKSFTRFQVEPRDTGSRLWILDDYGRLPEAERRARVGEVDLSLPAWGRALHGYLRAWSRWSGLAPWRWYMDGVWRPTRPLARRIVRLLFWATVAELLLFLGLVLALRGDGLG